MIGISVMKVLTSSGCLSSVKTVFSFAEQGSRFPAF